MAVIKNHNPRSHIKSIQVDDDALILQVGHEADLEAFQHCAWKIQGGNLTLEQGYSFEDGGRSPQGVIHGSSLKSVRRTSGTLHDFRRQNFNHPQDNSALVKDRTARARRKAKQNASSST